MALHWDWKNKVGTITYKYRTGFVATYNLYHGNAWLIAVDEYKDERTRQDCYAVANFVIDKDHLKNMLGLSKGYDKIDLLPIAMTLYTNTPHLSDILSLYAKAKHPITFTLIDPPTE